MYVSGLLLPPSTKSVFQRFHIENLNYKKRKGLIDKKIHNFCFFKVSAVSLFLPILGRDGAPTHAHTVLSPRRTLMCLKTHYHCLAIQTLLPTPSTPLRLLSNCIIIAGSGI